MNLEKEIFDISLQDIIPNRFQPREIFNDDELKELSESIKQHGVIQPIIVRKVGDKYEIIAGERRFRASQLAGKETIPALVRDIDDKEAAKIALLENLQRSNLTPIEEAKTYQTILKIDNITQDELATTLGKSQSAIANKLRLLTLNEEVQTALLNTQISERHARSLIGLTNEQQLELLHKTINEKLTVRQLDEEIMKMTGKAPGSEMNIDINEGEINMDNGLNNNDTLNLSNSSGILNTTIPGVENKIEENNINEPNIPMNNVETTMPNVENQAEQPLQPDLNNLFPKVELPEHEKENTISTEEAKEQVEMPTIDNLIPENSQPNSVELPKVEVAGTENVIETPTIETPAPETQPIPQQSEIESALEMPKIEIPTPEVQPTIEQTSENTINAEQSEPKQEGNIFDKLRVQRDETENESKFDLKTPDLSAVINPQPEIKQEENNNKDIYDLRFAINNFRQAVQNTEKFGFKVNVSEKELDDKYQIIIEIDKK